MSSARLLQLCLALLQSLSRLCHLGLQHSNLCLERPAALICVGQLAFGDVQAVRELRLTLSHMFVCLRRAPPELASLLVLSESYMHMHVQLVS